MTSASAMRSESMKTRFGFALCVALATAMLYAEGVLKDGLIEVAMLAPVVWFLVSSRPSELFKTYYCPSWSCA